MRHKDRQFICLFQESRRDMKEKEEKPLMKNESGLPLHLVYETNVLL